VDYDIAIIGGGPSGLAFACMADKSGLKVVVIEKQEQEILANPPEDGRDIALTHLSLEILQKLGVWHRFDAEQISSIKEARVVDGDSPYCLSFDTNQGNDDALGYLIANHLIRKAVYEQVISQRGIKLLTGHQVTSVQTHEDRGEISLANGQSITAELIVAADTRFSASRRNMGISADILDFGRTAIVCEMAHELPHNNVAFERFLYGRTLAVLPMPGNVSSIVITVPANLIDTFLNMTTEQFNQDVSEQLGGQLGAMKLITERYPYPLVAVHAERFYARRFALIGDAAVGMHPVTAHGYNLGLSGADILAGEMQQALDKGMSFSSEKVLRQYNHRHRQTTLPLFHGTNRVVGLFTNDSFPATLARKMVLRLSNNLPPVKWAIKQKLMSKRQFNLPPLPLMPAKIKLPFID
jgi:ubiquinone biosynthesis UbiH/UbiF/VisC/COQ6 family hydroxylase